MKNPAFGAFLTDDENAAGFDVSDRSVNVEREALKSLSGVRRRGYTDYPFSTPKVEVPFATKNFVIKTTADRSTQIIIKDGVAEIVWKSPPSPCCVGELVNLLCDGHIPTCEPYQGISENMEKAGYAPTGCKAYKKCSANWVKKIQINKNISRR